ncbi:huntingtin isoform X2 [Bicyclus anynana]|uniref:Huntingtin isoform X2 n=1 Tax=Bicyclus anynana TaxID=110368 RepID=A0ABM3M1D4_BICAN|nr:huntingtin isoform X2 [Bicyclus anynana]
MNVLEKAEKALEYLKNSEGLAKGHELQAAAGTLGRCLGALGGRQNCARHYANLLHSAIPTLLNLASNDSAEVRLLGDEALNRAVAGGFAFHSYKTNIILQNQIDINKNARWIRAALSRICIGDCWLRPGVGKIRYQAQTLFPKLSQIVRQTNEIQLIVEALDQNLPRLLTGLAEYTTDEEISELSKALLGHVECTEPAVRRGIANCVAHLCSHREPLLTNVLARVYEKLWPTAQEDNAVIGWFCVIKAIFQINNITKFKENDIFSAQDYLELYQLCVHYIEQTTTEHNIQNTVMECLSVLLSQAKDEYKRALLEKNPRVVCLDERRSEKGHRRNISYTSAISSRTLASIPLDVRDTEITFTGALQLGSLLQLNSECGSTDELAIQTPDSPESDMELNMTDADQLSRDLSEKLREYEDDVTDDDGIVVRGGGMKINIGTSSDDDVRLKYCSRLLVSKFLLTGNKGGIISDRIVRVSVKSSALSCISVIMQLYPQAATLYLDKDADLKFQNYSGSSEGTDTNPDNTNEFIIERNVCYQDSITESLSQELLNRSMDSQSQQIFKKDSKSLEKSTDSEQKNSSSKDIQSNILDSKAFAKDLIASGLSADSTNPNMTNSNFTTNSNMTGSIDHISTGYPMSSSGDILSSSIDLDMKFDHFGESTMNMDNNVDNMDTSKDEKRVRKELKRMDEMTCDSKDVPPDTSDVNLPVDMDKNDNFEYQHMSEVFVLLEGHNDPQIRGLVRVCVGNYLVAALDLAHGDYNRWRSYSLLPKEISTNFGIDKLMDIVLKGLSDEIHSSVNHTLTALLTLSSALCNSVHWWLMNDALNSLISVMNNNYWLVRVNLAKLYESLPYSKLFTLHPEYYNRSKLIMDALLHLLADQDQKVRTAAAQAITSIVPKIYPPRRATPISMMTNVSKDHIQMYTFDSHNLSLELVRDIYFYNDLPEQLKKGKSLECKDSLMTLIGDLVGRLMASNCKYYSQGLLETLRLICLRWSPWKHIEAYTEQGILSYCLDSLDYCNGVVSVRTMLLDICRLVYPVEIHNIMRHRTTNRDIFERDTQEMKEKWHHLENDRVANLAEKFLQVTLKMLNVLVHLIEDVNPNVHLNRSGIALPGSPVRRKTQDSIQRKGSITSESDDKGIRKRPPVPATSLKANFAGHFFNEPFYMRLYENLRATYSNHKINLDPKTSIFHEFLSTTLNCLAIQLEMATDREFGPVTEEILFYLKVMLPLNPNLTVYCITQLLKCLFGTNMINQYTDYMSIADKRLDVETPSFFQDVMLVNALKTIEDDKISISSNSSQKLSLDSKNPRMIDERQMLIAMENFSKNRTDRKWSTNKKELERYIRLFEPVVIQSLKSYTLQNDIPLQCSVLRLLNQLLALRVNYCMLDSDQVFIAFLMKQLDLIEQHEIPNCCDLVNSILLFLVQLSSSKHHTKTIIEIPKLIQLCDGLMASGAQDECIAGLEPVAVKMFSNMGGSSVLGRAQQQEIQATREVLFYMLQKTMHQPKVLDLVSCVLSLSQEHPESYYRWSELASDTLLNLLSERSIECDSIKAVESLERLLQSLYRDVLLEQTRVEILLKILFKAPPDQDTTPRKLKLRYLTIVMVLLRKVLVLIPETEVLLSINYLKSTCISPQSIFFNVKPNVDPLNVQNVNENCANLSPDVILVRFLFKTLTYVIMEMNDFQVNVDLVDEEDKDQNRLLYAVCVNIIVQAKHMLHLTNGCLFPLTAKMAQTILHNEQSGLNTGLYSPEENIPLDVLNLICLKVAHRIPTLTLHWSHLLIRLNFLSHKYWQKLIGFARNLPLSADNSDNTLLRVDLLQTACVMAYCEYFVDNGLSEAVHLTWLLVNRVHVLVSQFDEDIIRQLIDRVQQAAGASGLMLQAVAARCQSCLKDDFALNTYKILSLCHESQSGALVFLICRIIGKLEPAIATRFAKLAIHRCQMLKDMSIEAVNSQLSKEDVQVALELLQRDKVHVRFSNLVVELNALASTVFDLSPLDLSQDRAINAQYIVTTNVDSNWLLNQIKSRCCQVDCTAPKVSMHTDLANLLSTLPLEALTNIMTCPEFDRKILSACFKVACESFTRDFLNSVSIYELRETEIEAIRQQREMARIQEEMTSSVDSNKLNVVNSLHVFKKNDHKESKSQFFIPIMENDVREKFGNLKLIDEDTDIMIPELPKLYLAAVATLDKSLADVLRLFPKQNRPLSQSENFSLNVEQTIDRYTRRCHQVFQDKLFYQEFITIQTILTGFLDAVDKVLTIIDETDCDLLEKCVENIITNTLARNIAVFSVVSLQYLSFLIKNKKVVETPVHTDVSFRVTNATTDNVCVDHVMVVTIDNVAKALRFNEIWCELNVESNFNRTQSAISCLYAIVKYLVKDTKPLTLTSHMKTQDSGPQPDIIITGNKLATLVEYWEQNFYVKDNKYILGKRHKIAIESLLISLARLELVSNVALIPPIAWSYVEVKVKADQLEKIDLPLQPLQDLDVLEAFLFRVNLIGWSSKKQFEEIWVGILGALQGNGTHWAVNGITQLLLSVAPSIRGKMLHVPRKYQTMTEGMQRLRNILIGTTAYSIFEDTNLERIPLVNEGHSGFHYGQFSTEFLKYSADISDDASYRVRKEVKRKRKYKEIDINSCLQLLMDVTTDMLDPKSPTGIAGRVALVKCAAATSVGAVLSTHTQWSRAAALLSASPPPQWALAAACALHSLAACLPVLHPAQQELTNVHEKLLKSLSSSFPPLRQAALRGWLLQLTQYAQVTQPEAVTQLLQTTVSHLKCNFKLSLHEQSLYWAVLFTLVELGHPDLMNTAVDFVVNNPRHYCADLVVKGITSVLRQQVLPKDLKNIVIEKLLDIENMKKYSENHAVRILMVHLFSADNRLISPKLESDVSNMDPDILMNSMERITLLYKILRQCKHRENKNIVASALKYFLRETLPPAATLSRVVIEYLECCKETEKKKMAVLSQRDRWMECSVLNAEIVFEVFEASVAQDQLPVLSGWIFEALCHLLSGKISTKLLPYCLLTLLVSASSNQFIRSISPLSYHIFRVGLHKCSESAQNWGVFADFVEKCAGNMTFSDRRLLCIVALHSNYTVCQLERLKELCDGNDTFNDLMQCLTAV